MRYRARQGQEGVRQAPHRERARLRSRDSARHAHQGQGRLTLGVSSGTQPLDLAFQPTTAPALLILFWVRLTPLRTRQPLSFLLPFRQNFLDIANVVMNDIPRVVRPPRDDRIV
ncbi:hypothetical protein PSEUDO9AG_50564 [Pseudomonas sp. 9Ag]|nr:hypothetical protein PSEUDO9AG_50564 [Pseudomonas sp. 9Ag]